MSWLLSLFNQDSVPHTLLIISLVVASGLVLGRLSLAGIQLGIAGVLFSGLIFGHFHLSINPEVMHFLREFGLVLFVYAIGLQVGPSFVSAFFRYGLRLNGLAAAVVLLGALIAVLISIVGDIPMPVAVGLFSGATTNTPSLAAAQQVLDTLPNIGPETLKMPGLGYAVAYPFGIAGIILAMLLNKRLFKIDIAHEAKLFDDNQQQHAHVPIWKDLKVENPNLNGLMLSQIPFFEGMNVVMTRILHNGQVDVAGQDSRLTVGDTIRLVGEREPLEQLKILIGPESDIDLKQIATNLHSKRLVVTNKAAINETIGNLCLLYGVTISRIHRPDVEFSPTSHVHVQFGDELHVVGSQDALTSIEKALGNSLEELDHPQIMPIFIGISLGVLLGSFPLYLPGIPSAVKLGMAGGPLLVAIMLSRIGNWGAMTWHLPKSSNIILKDIGIVLFLACVGLHSGDQFVETLVKGDGFYWMACAALITLLPLLAVAAVGRIFYKLNFLSLCGLLAGSMTDPPALAFANNLSPSAAVSMAYATVYPLVMILRIIAAQLIILLVN
ncbi:putative transporter [Methylomonas sp. EFPC3]|uniref:putative transporter n=1 Tax=Methylomonas sp. EFPC3 TaxID=3021710 RepID=UPI0024166830|nr:putative transporter [Methylomonas sp. EFPC3]WFP50211.1 putative transporter [Methylomonas sp. EFPC3]